MAMELRKAEVHDGFQNSMRGQLLQQWCMAGLPWPPIVLLYNVVTWRICVKIVNNNLLSFNDPALLFFFFVFKRSCHNVQVVFGPLMDRGALMGKEPLKIRQRTHVTPSS